MGYVAYVLLITRAIILEGAGWLLWVEKLDQVPPPRLLLTCYAALVILLRVVLEIALQNKKKIASQAVTAVTPPASIVNSPVETTTPVLNTENMAIEKK